MGDDTYTLSWKEYIFLSFRFGIFVLIICFPCYRGIRIWYSAGGRIVWSRHAQTHQIMGLQYRPADYDQWLILTGMYNPHSMATTTNNTNTTGTMPPSQTPKLTEAE